MSITPEEIHALARESRLNVTNEELPLILKYMGNFLIEIERMNELELENVPLFDFMETSCPMREDIIVENPYREDILIAAPEREGDYYRVARILEE